MANELGLRSYQGVQQQAITDEFLSSSAPRAFAGENQQRVIQSSTGNVSSSSRIVFSIPSGTNEFIKPGSAYVSVSISVTNDNAGTIVSARKSRLFNSIFKAAQLTANGVLVERRDNTNDISAFLYAHASSPNFYASDATCLEGSAFDAGLAPPALQVFLPVPLGCFNSLALPMWALPSTNVLLELETDTLAGMFSTNIGNVTGVTFANAQLVYESLLVDSSLVQMLKEEMISQQMPYVIPIQECRVFQQAGAASNNVILGLNLSSVDCVAVIQRATPAAFTDLENYTAPAGAMRFDLYANAVKVNQANRTSAISCLPDLNVALSKIYDVACVSTFWGLNMTRTSYASNVFACAQNLRKTNNKSVLLPGRACNSIQVDLAGFTAANLLILVFHDSLINIDVSSGAVTMLR